MPKPKKPDAPFKSSGGWSIPPISFYIFSFVYSYIIRLFKLGGETNAVKESGVFGVGSSMPPEELSMVSKVGGLDLNMLQQSVQKLIKSFQEVKIQVREGEYTAPESESSVGSRSIDLTRDIFQQAMEKFIEEAVKQVNTYFYDNEAARNDSEHLKVFVVVRQFLIMLEKACKDVIRDNAQTPGTKKWYSPDLKARD